MIDLLMTGDENPDISDNTVNTKTKAEKSYTIESTPVPNSLLDWLRVVENRTHQQSTILEKPND